MTDDLRTRIAAVHQAHRCFYRGDRTGFGCHCGWTGQSAEHDLHVADAVIAELGLRKVTDVNRSVPQSRYVTDWEPE